MLKIWLEFAKNFVIVECDFLKVILSKAIVSNVIWSKEVLPTTRLVYC